MCSVKNKNTNNSRFSTHISPHIPVLQRASVRDTRATVPANGPDYPSLEHTHCQIKYGPQIDSRLERVYRGICVYALELNN
jgi:hypothetical protein